MVESREVLQPGISAIVPVFNSERSLPLLMKRLEAVLSTLATDFEVILVDDGSRDRSWETVCELARTNSFIRGIQLLRNYGQHNALLCGVRAARYSITVTLDDDGQHPPEEIPKLIRRLQESNDLVFGIAVTRRHGFCRDLASRITKIAIRSILGTEMARHVSPFRAFHTHVRSAFAEYRGAFISLDVLLGWGVSRVASVQVRHDARRFGRTNYTFGRLVSHSLNMITSFSLLPLQLASIIGFIFTLFGLGILCYVLAIYFIRGDSVAGFPFLASIIAIFSGAQLFALGIIGEYLARIHFRTMNKPAYAVAEVVGAERTRPAQVEQLFTEFVTVL